MQEILPCISNRKGMDSSCGGPGQLLCIEIKKNFRNRRKGTEISFAYLTIPENIVSQNYIFNGK